MSRSNFYPLRPRRVAWIKTEREGVKSGRSGALKREKLGLACKANKCSDAGTGDFGVLPTQETLSMNPVMPAQPAPGECRHMYELIVYRGGACLSRSSVPG